LLEMKTYVLIDARYASKAVHRIGKDRQTLDYASLLSVLTNQQGCKIVSAQYIAPKDQTPVNGASEEAMRNRMKKDNYHKTLAAPPPDGPGLLIYEAEGRSETCKCPSCSKDFQVQIQNGVDVLFVTQILRFGLTGDAQCIAIFAPDGSYLRAVKLAKAKGVNIVCIGSKEDCPELAALSNKQIWLEEIWEFVALTKKNAKPVDLPNVKNNLRQSPVQIMEGGIPTFKLPEDHSDIMPVRSVEIVDDVSSEYVAADLKKSTFSRRREEEDHGILMAEERRRRRQMGMISIEQEIEDRKIAIALQKEENTRGR